MEKREDSRYEGDDDKSGHFRKVPRMENVGGVEEALEDRKLSRKLCYCDNRKYEWTKQIINWTNSYQAVENV